MRQILQPLFGRNSDLEKHLSATIDQIRSEEEAKAFLEKAVAMEEAARAEAEAAGATPPGVLVVGRTFSFNIQSLPRTQTSDCTPRNAVQIGPRAARCSDTDCGVAVNKLCTHARTHARTHTHTHTHTDEKRHVALDQLLEIVTQSQQEAAANPEVFVCVSVRVCVLCVPELIPLPVPAMHKSHTQPHTHTHTYTHTPTHTHTHTHKHTQGLSSQLDLSAEDLATLQEYMAERKQKKQAAGEL